MQLEGGRAWALVADSWVGVIQKTGGREHGVGVVCTLVCSCMRCTCVTVCVCAHVWVHVSWPT